MKKKRGSLGYLTKEGFRNLWVNRMMSVASIAVLMSCLVMMGTAFMVLVNVERILNIVEEENIVSVYLEMDATLADVEQVKEDILLMENVTKCEFVSKEQAFREALEKNEFDANSELFAGIENPLPDMYEVSMEDEKLFDETIAKLERIDNVDVVRGSKDIANILIQIRSTVSYVSVGIIVVLLLISLFIIANTIRITMFNRRLEINIMKSVGATNWFIRWPFIVEGMLLGAISAVVSLGAVWGIYELLEKLIYELLGLMSRAFVVADFKAYALYVLAAFIVIGVLSGGCGSFISIQRYLKERGGVVYDDEE